MYHEFFKFKQDPFDITPDPEFLFLSPSHKEASGSIFYGIETRKGFVAVTGEVGLGKTTILRSYLEGTDPEKIRIVYIFNSAVSFDKLLRQICADLGIPVGNEDQAELLDILFYHLIEEYRKDHNVVLIIDEAQNMPVETLERLRVLTNLETSQDKLIQIILAGQPELEAKLELPELRHLNQRIAIRSHIEALTADESVAYIHHRLMKASSFHNPVFTKKAMKLIIKQAGGVPRTINILCDNALVTAFGYLRKPVDEKIIKEVIRDFRGKKTRSGWRRKVVWTAVVAACLAGAFFVSANVMSLFELPPTENPSLSTKPAASMPAAVKAEEPQSALPEKMPAVKPIPTVSGKPLSGQTAAAPKTAPTAPAVKSHTAGIAAKPESVPAAPGAKGPTGSVSEGKNGSAVAQSAGAGSEKSPPAGVTVSAEKQSQTPSKKTSGEGTAPAGTAPAVAGSSVANSAPGALPASTAKASPPVSPKAPGSLSARGAGAQPGAALAPAPGVQDNSSPNPSVVVKKGDSVTKLLFGVYGKVDDKMLQSFRTLNPQITNINKLLVGEKILLPQTRTGQP
ncbi:MAG: AAA family ATPase [Syntrophobacteraceae bacterium]